MEYRIKIKHPGGEYNIGLKNLSPGLDRIEGQCGCQSDVDDNFVVVNFKTCQLGSDKWCELFCRALDAVNESYTRLNDKS